MAYEIREAIEMGATLQDLFEMAGVSEEEWEEEEDDLEPSFDIEEGFDPYMGDYSWDC